MNGDVHPGACIRCAAELTPPCTFECGHTYCSSCADAASQCYVCHRPKLEIEPLHFLTFRCGGCGKNYSAHANTRINQIHILPCHHRRLCSHATKECKVCGQRHNGAIAIDYSATAVHCGVSLRHPDVPRYRCNPRPSAARRLCRAARACWSRAKAQRRRGYTPKAGGL